MFSVSKWSNAFCLTTSDPAFFHLDPKQCNAIVTHRFRMSSNRNRMISTLTSLMLQKSGATREMDPQLPFRGFRTSCSWFETPWFPILFVHWMGYLIVLKGTNINIFFKKIQNILDKIISLPKLHKTKSPQHFLWPVLYRVKYLSFQKKQPAAVLAPPSCMVRPSMSLVVVTFPATTPMLLGGLIQPVMVKIGSFPQEVKIKDGFKRVRRRHL